MIIMVQGIEIEVLKKQIKNLHLSVLPPNGAVRISVPSTISDESIRLFAASKISWIKEQQIKFKTQLRHNEREYVSGETLFIWGKQHYLKVEYSNKGNGFEIQGKTVILTVRKESTAQQRENYVHEVLRGYLKAEITRLLPIWEAKTKLKCKRWQTRYMKTHWGSYSEKTQTITFNLQLVKKPIECLDFIIVHELGHMKFRNHGKGFIEYMDRTLLFWRETKQLLNDFTLDYIDDDPSDNGNE